MSQTLNKKEVDAILHTDLHDAFSLLGAHLVTRQGKKQAVVRALLRDAKAVVVAELDGERREWPMACAHKNGLFELVVPERQQLFRYELRITDFRGGQRVTRDPY
jgi:1,4-alpha-glucan branching enzyme